MASTWYHTRTTLNGRNGPSTSHKIIYVAKPGHNFLCVQKVTGGGRTWLVSSTNTYYAAEYCAVGKSASARVASPVPGVGVGTPWGRKPRNRTYWQTRGHHTGADYPGRYGAAVVAVQDGTVARRWDRVLGNVALLYTHDRNGRQVTYWCCHMSSITRTGKVKAGQQIGKVGATGTGAIGPHCHLEIRTGHTSSWAGRDYNPVGTW